MIPIRVYVCFLVRVYDYKPSSGREIYNINYKRYLFDSVVSRPKEIIVVRLIMRLNI